MTQTNGQAWYFCLRGQQPQGPIPWPALQTLINARLIGQHDFIGPDHPKTLQPLHRLDIQLSNSDSTPNPFQAPRTDDPLSIIDSGKIPALLPILAQPHHTLCWITGLLGFPMVFLAMGSLRGLFPSDRPWHEETEIFICFFTALWLFWFAQSAFTLASNIKTLEQTATRQALLDVFHASKTSWRVMLLFIIFMYLFIIVWVLLIIPQASIRY